MTDLPTTPIASDADLDLIFRAARTHSSFADKPVSDVLLQAVWDLAKMGPTSANSQPARIVFVRSPEGKERLKPALSQGNLAKTMAAPVTAIVAYDLTFYERLPELYPGPDARSWFEGKPEWTRFNALQSGSLQGAYLMLAARALGLDCGPMGGFDHEIVDRAFFPDSPIKSNFLCNLGYGDGVSVKPRNKRLSFEQACQIV